VFVIESVDGGACLEFRGDIPRGRDAYESFEVAVRLYRGGVEASDRVVEHLGHRWTELFESLAKDWRGWEGERAVETLEHQLRVSCRSDRLGHIELRVEMRGDMSGSDWRAADTIQLEAGQLQDLARRAREYFG
jgi:hypothetical protein